MARKSSRQQVGILAIGMILAGFAVMYLGVCRASSVLSALGLAVTAAGALVIVLRF